MDVLYKGSNDPRLARATHQDRLAYATTLQDLPAALDGDHASQLAVARMSKLLAWVIPDLSNIPPPHDHHLVIDVFPGEGIDPSPYLSSPKQIAMLLGYRGKLEFRVNDGTLPPSPIVIFLFASLCETNPLLRSAYRAQSILAGFSKNRLLAGLQSLYLHFSGYGEPSNIDAVMGDSIELTGAAGETCRYAWKVGPAPSRLVTDGLLSVEEHIDRLSNDVGLDKLHPLAGSVVSIDGHQLYVGGDGLALISQTGRLAICKPVSPGLYDLLELSGNYFHPIPAELMLAHGPALDNEMADAVSRRPGGRPVDLSSARRIATNSPAVSLEHLWQSARHFVFDDDDDDDDRFP